MSKKLADQLDEIAKRAKGSPGPGRPATDVTLTGDDLEVLAKAATELRKRASSSSDSGS
jgi:hypothetical protein